MKVGLLLQGLGRPIAFHPGLVRVTGSVNATIFLSQFIYWADKGSDPDGWIYKVQSEIQEETALTIRMQEKARKELRRLGLLEEKRQGIPAQLFYRVNLEKLDILWRECCETRSDKSADLDPTKARNKSTQNRGTSQDFSGGLYTETTAETTAETTTPPPTPQGEPEGWGNPQPSVFVDPEPDRSKTVMTSTKKIENPRRKQELSERTIIPPPEIFIFESKAQRIAFWKQVKEYKLKNDPKLSEGSAEAIANAMLVRLQNGEARPDDEYYLERFLDGSLEQDNANPRQNGRLAQEFNQIMNALENL